MDNSWQGDSFGGSLSNVKKDMGTTGYLLLGIFNSRDIFNHQYMHH